MSLKTPRNVKASKEVTDREKACIFVMSVFLLQGPSVASAMAELFNPRGSGEEEPGFLGVLLGFARGIKEAITKLVASDEEYYRAKAALTAAIRQRNELTERASKRIVGLRRTLVGQHEVPDLGQLGFEVETAREGVPVLRQLDRIGEVFENGELDELLGPPIFEGAGFDPKDLGTQLGRDADGLRSQLDLVGERQSQVQNAFLVKQADQKAHDEMFLRTTRIFEDSCRLIGRSELADRVRPSTRRPGRTEEPPEELPEETAEEILQEVAASAAAGSAADLSGSTFGDSFSGVEVPTSDGG